MNVLFRPRFSPKTKADMAPMKLKVGLAMQVSISSTQLVPSNIIQRDNSALQIRIRIAHSLQKVWCNDDSAEYTLVVAFAVH